MVLAPVTYETRTLTTLRTQVDEASRHLEEGFKHLEKFIKLADRIRSEQLWKESQYSTWDEFYTAHWGEAINRSPQWFRLASRALPVQQVVFQTLNITVTEPVVRAAMAGLDCEDKKEQAVKFIKRAYETVKAINPDATTIAPRHVKAVRETINSVKSGTLSVSGTNVNANAMLDAGLDPIALSDVEGMIESNKRYQEYKKKRPTHKGTIIKLEITDTETGEKIHLAGFECEIFLLPEKKMIIREVA